MTALYDRRRVNGPEESFLPLFDVEVNESVQETEPLFALNEQRLIRDPSLQSKGQLKRTMMTLGQDKLALPRIAREDLSKRADERSETEARPLCKSNLSLLKMCRWDWCLTRAGVRFWSVGEQSLLVLCRSPILISDMDHGSDLERFRPGKDVESPSAAALVEQALLPTIRLDLLPKASIDVYVTVLDLDTSLNGCIALAVTGASASLADAGIEMFGLISATSLPYNGNVYQKWLVDPSAEEAALASTDLLLCSMPAIGRTTCYSLQGPAHQFQELQKRKGMVKACGDRLDQQKLGDLKQSKAVIRQKHDLPPDMYKYWHARHDLFSRYSEGILLDTESWYSVTPEAVAYRLAAQCACHTILDAFCGAGGNAIQFAMTCERVIAIDIDPLKVALARHNAQIYGVQERITFLSGDVREFVRDRAQKEADDEKWGGCLNLDFDVIFLSPPWGGVGYLNPSLPEDGENQKFLDEYSLTELSPLKGQDLFRLARQISNNVVLYLPRNTNLYEISRLPHVEPDTRFNIRIEELWLGYKLKALAVYISEASSPTQD